MNSASALVLVGGLGIEEPCRDLVKTPAIFRHVDTVGFVVPYLAFEVQQVHPKYCEPSSYFAKALFYGNPLHICFPS